MRDDGDQPFRQLLRQELEGHGYVVHEAVDGHEAVRMARALGPDLVTLDVMMPDGNGFDVAQALRHDPATLRIPILVVSVVHDEVRATAVGVDRYLTKPVDGADLHAQVEALLAEGGRHGHVVVADSDRPTLDTLREILVEQGWVVTTASDLHTVAEVVRTALPDLVIARADPADPYRLVDLLRTDPVTQHVVVVLFE